MNRIDFATINASLNGETLVPQWLPEGKRQGREWVSRNPTRGDKNPGSFTINLKSGKWADFSTGDEGGDLVSLYAYLFHANDNGKAARELADLHGITMDAETREQTASNVKQLKDSQPKVIMPAPADAPEPNFHHFRHGEPSHGWPYYDGKGGLLLFVCRFDHEDGTKDIVPLSYCDHPGKGKRWTWRGITGSTKRPLYGLDRLAGMPGIDVVLVEGEKAAEAAQRLLGDHAVALAWLGGTGTADKVNLRPLSGRRVFLWPDFDSKHYGEKHERAGQLMDLHEQPGIKAMLAITAGLAGVASEVHMVGYTPEGAGGQFPDTWDLADAEQQGWQQSNVLQYMGLHAGDPYRVADGQSPALDSAPATVPSAECAAVPEQPSDVHRMPSISPVSWPNMSGKGVPLNTVPNLKHLLDHYGFRVCYDVIRKDLLIRFPGQSGTVDNQRQVAINTVLSLCALNRLPKAEAPAFLMNVADENQVNPVMDWITSKPWDGHTRLPDLEATLQTRPDYDRALLGLLLRRWLVSAVAAAAKPHGFRSKGVLTLQGQQSIGKTAWFMALVPEEQRDLLKVDALIDTRDKDTITSAVSHWLVELGELDGTFRKSDIARLKGFISADYDQFRRPYARAEEKYPRKTVFFASVNDDAFLVDDTGNTRWWTVPVTRVNFQHGIDMQQLWAEVYALYRDGEQWWLNQEEERLLEGANDDHRQVSPIEELILSAYNPEAPQVRELTATEVLMEIGIDKPSNGQAQKAGKVLADYFGPLRRKKGRRLYGMPKPVITTAF